MENVVFVFLKVVVAFSRDSGVLCWRGQSRNLRHCVREDVGCWQWIAVESAEERVRAVHELSQGGGVLAQLRRQIRQDLAQAGVELWVQAAGEDGGGRRHDGRGLARGRLASSLRVEVDVAVGSGVLALARLRALLRRLGAHDLGHALVPLPVAHFAVARLDGRAPLPELRLQVLQLRRHLVLAVVRHSALVELLRDLKNAIKAREVLRSILLAFILICACLTWPGN